MIKSQLYDQVEPLNLTYPHIGRSKHTEMTEFLREIDRVQLKKIIEIYRHDFEIFGYDYDISFLSK